MPRPTPPSRRLAGRGALAALDALASPARQELLAALGDGRASVRELADRLGRSRPAVHYHAGVLEKAGLIRAVEWRGEGREREAVYACDPGALTVPARATSRKELDAGQRAAQAMLRFTGRELAQASRDAAVAPASPAGGARELIALRGKARLSAAGLKRVNALIDRLLDEFGRSSTRGDGKLYALTLVLTPSRDAAASPSPRARRRGRSA